MLEIKNLSIMINTRYLIKDLSLTLNKNDKLAVIGEEGNGKSSLLKAILGISDYANVTGSINLNGERIGYLKQSLSDEELSLEVFNYLFKNEEDYYDKINSFYKFLKLVSISDEVLKRKLYTLSGGERVKVSILKLLLDDYDVLFLDEPTNDLDIETLDFLERFIKETKKPIMFVSHDEVLLSNCANVILHLEQLKNKSEPRWTLLKTDYQSYVLNRNNMIKKENMLAKEEQRKFKEKEEKLRRVMEKVEHDQNMISRQNPHGAKMLKRKMKSLKSQEKKLYSFDVKEAYDTEEEINLWFDEKAIPSKKVILDFQLKKLKNKDKLLAKDIKLYVKGPTSICITGQNGVGKTTLLKLIYEELKKRNDLLVGYMPQDYNDVLSGFKNVIDFISKDKSKEEITKSRTYLGNLNFTKEEMNSDINLLSGGTKAKLLLAKLVLDGCNVLVLDEPTRNLSPLSNPVIRCMLANFKGAIISVSHDRMYINEVSKEVYELTYDGLLKF